MRGWEKTVYVYIVQYSLQFQVSTGGLETFLMEKERLLSWRWMIIICKYHFVFIAIVDAIYELY